jgi:hypothetical protein
LTSDSLSKSSGGPRHLDRGAGDRGLSHGDDAGPRGELARIAHALEHLAHVAHRRSIER